jgi:hypothetical protein
MNHNDHEEIGPTVADFVAEGEALEASITHNAEIAKKETEDAYGESALALRRVKHFRNLPWFLIA